MRLPFHLGLTSALVLLGGLSFSLWGQTFQGSIAGVVTDPTGALIPGATITAVREGKGISRQTVTLDDGNYELVLLPPGEYRLTAQKAGFDTIARGPLTLLVNQHLRLDFQMRIGEQTTTVLVEAAPPVVDTQGSSLGTTVSKGKVDQVPLNGRHFLELTLLAPGVVPGTSGSRISNRGGAINVNGLQESMNSYWLDGLDDTAIGVGQFTVVPPLGSIQEFRMETGGYEAKFGAHAGAQVNIVTKSGSNQLHGSLHEFLRNSSFDARNFFDPEVPPFRRNQFGGELGGPVVFPGLYDGHDRTFFFVGYEGLRERRSFFNRARVPTLAERNGDFNGDVAADCSSKSLLVNVLTGGPIANPDDNSFQALGMPIDPVGQALVNLYPPPNISGAPCGGVNYMALVRRQLDQNNFFGRVDQMWGSANSLFVRYNLNFDHEVLPPATSSRAPLTNIPGFGTLTHDAYQMAGLDWTHIFTPTVINELKLGYNRWQIRETTEDQGNPIAQQLGIQGITRNNPEQSGVPNLNFAGYDSLGAGDTDPQRGAVNTFQVADTLTHVSGNHSLAYGADLRTVNRGNFTIDSLIRGQFNFTGLVTGGLGQVQLPGCESPGCTLGNAVADALLGLPAFWINGFEQNISGHLGEYDFFGQDTWRVRSNLTLTMGIRYEYKGLSTDKYDRFANFDFSRGLLMVAGRSAVTLEDFDPISGTFLPAGTATLGSRGENRSVQHPDKNNFAPRFGFAWQPFHDSRTVLRGGYGIFYNQTFGDVFFQKAANPPFVRISAGNIGAALPLVQAGQFPLGSGAILQNALAGVVGPAFPTVSPFQLNFQDAIIHEWSFDVQRELRASWLFDAGYVGTRGLRLPRETDPNQPVPDPITQTAAARYPNLAGFSYTQSSGTSIYHALQLKVERHYSRGLAVLAGYTFSKSLDTNSSAFTTDRDQNFPQNSRNLAAEKGRSDFDFRHRLSIGYVYDLPLGSTAWKLHHARANYLLEGWELSGILTAESGPPFTPQISGNLSQADEQSVIGTGYPTDRPNLTGSSFYPSHKTPDQYVLSSAFSAPEPFTFGNAGRNILTGPGLGSWDFSLGRKFRLAESKMLEFRAEMFNLLNRSNFDIPRRDAASPSFGMIFNTLRPVAGLASGGPGDPRELQFALKLNW